MRSSPRASNGFRMFPASMAPSTRPAPTTVCSSSRNSTIRPWASWTSARTAFKRSSNSPRYFAPAIRAPMSRATTRRSFSVSGTSPSTIRRARPSTIAVFPTPGSPTSTGLFLVRRLRIWMVRRISSSRPTTGSSFPDRANSVRSRPNCSSGFWGDCSASGRSNMRSLLEWVRLLQGQRACQIAIQPRCDASVAEWNSEGFQDGTGGTTMAATDVALDPRPQVPELQRTELEMRFCASCTASFSPSESWKCARSDEIESRVSCFFPKMAGRFAIVSM